MAQRMNAPNGDQQTDIHRVIEDGKNSGIFVFAHSNLSQNDFHTILSRLESVPVINALTIVISADISNTNQHKLDNFAKAHPSCAITIQHPLDAEMTDTEHTGRHRGYARLR